MTIDPEKLELAVERLSKDNIKRRAHGWLMTEVRWEDGDVLEEAARAHLATLPRYKEVEVAQWASVDHAGEVHGVWDHESQARDSVGLDDGLSVVRLTGTAKVRA